MLLCWGESVGVWVTYAHHAQGVVFLTADTLQKAPIKKIEEYYCEIKMFLETLLGGISKILCGHYNMPINRKYCKVRNSGN